MLKKLVEDPSVFEARFSRSYRLLYFIACRVLSDPERADEAIENCWINASRNPPRFEYENAFRSWLLRVLINEALALLRNGKGMAKGTIQQPVSLAEYERNQNLEPLRADPGVGD